MKGGMLLPQKELQPSSGDYRRTDLFGHENLLNKQHKEIVIKGSKHII